MNSKSTVSNSSKSFGSVIDKLEKLDICLIHSLFSNAQLLAISKQALPSVILFRLGNENYDEINQRLIEILNNCQQDLETGAIVSVNNETFRVKKLPI